MESTPEVSPFRIAVDARPLLDPRTGIGRYTYEILSRLIDQPGCHWHLYSTEALPAFWDTHPQVSVRHSLAGRGLLATVSAQWHFARWAKTDSVRVFWSPRHHLPLRLQGPRCVVTVHDLVWWRYPGTMPRGKAVLESWLMPRSIAMADSVIAVSQTTRDDLIARFPHLRVGDVDVIAEGVSASIADTTRDRKALVPTARPYVLAVGAAEPRKNALRLLSAYSAVIRSEKTFPKLVLAGGKGSISEELKRKINELGLQQDVELREDPNDEILKVLYRDALFFVSVSLYEGFNLPVLEAQANQLAVLASNNSATAETAGTAALLVDPTSDAAISEGLRRLWGNERLRATLAAAGERNLARFSWSRCAQQTLSTLTSGEFPGTGDTGVLEK